MDLTVTDQSDVASGALNLGQQIDRLAEYEDKYTVSVTLNPLKTVIGLPRGQGDPLRVSNRIDTPPAIYPTRSPQKSSEESFTLRDSIRFQDELSGGSFALDQVAGGTVSSLLNAIIVGERPHVSSEPNTTLDSVVTEICSTFGLTRKELIQVARIQSVEKLDSWIHTDEKAEKAAMNRLFDLYLVSDAWSTYGFGPDREQLFYPVIDGQSIFDMLNESNIDKELIIFSGSRLNLILPGRGNLLNP